MRKRKTERRDGDKEKGDRREEKSEGEKRNRMTHAE